MRRIGMVLVMLMSVGTWCGLNAGFFGWCRMLCPRQFDAYEIRFDPVVRQQKTRAAVKVQRASRLYFMKHLSYIAKKYSEDIVPENDVCPICLEGGFLFQTTCTHWFHKQCLEAWGTREAICPLCRHSFMKSNKNKHHL